MFTLLVGIASLEAALLAEKARCVEMELQVRALAAELLRSQQASMAIGRSVLPVLSGVEHRLVDMFTQAQAQRKAALGAAQQQLRLANGPMQPGKAPAAAVAH